MKPILVLLTSLVIVSSLPLRMVVSWSTLTGQSETRVVRWTERVSIASNGSEGNNRSGFLAISADGRYVAFESSASNLVGGDTNLGDDVFVHDRQMDITERASVASDGTEAIAGSGTSVAISADGRYVAFESSASNLVEGDKNRGFDIFVHDRMTGITERASVASDGTEANGNTLAVSDSVTISADGRYVGFMSHASNLVAGDTNSRSDIFVHDRKTGITERVSIASDGTEGNGNSCCSVDISAGGQYVVFMSFASNLVGGDANGVRDIFVHDRANRVTERVSVASDGTEGNDFSIRSAISADGRYVTFESQASNLVGGDANGVRDIFVHDRANRVTERVSVASDGTEGNGNSVMSAISADGRFVAFVSSASNLVGGDSNGQEDAFVHDRQTGIIERISVASDGTEGNDGSFDPSISADGRYIAFVSSASNLVAGDTNGWADVFIHGRVNVDNFLYLPVIATP